MKSKLVIGTVLILSFVARQGIAQDKLAVTLSTDRGQYVLREPMKFTVVMENISPDPIRIPEVQYFDDMNMAYMFLSLTGPMGEEERRYKWIYAREIGSAGYEGELLEPGEQIQFFLYPNVTFPSHGLSVYGRADQTFRQPGEYSVRVCYTVPPLYKMLYAPDSRRVYSNTVELRFRDPDESEREILDQLWSGYPQALILGEVRPLDLRVDEEALEAVLRKHPGHGLEPYVLFTLARSYSAITGAGGPDDPERAEEILEKLLVTHPGFRHEEVRVRLAVIYNRTGQQDKARALMDEAMQAHPLLRTNDDFMTNYMFITGGIRAISE
jgi:hypothetical protein